MKKRLLTEDDVKRMHKHNVLKLSGDELLTPQAKDYLRRVDTGCNGKMVAIGSDHRGFRLKTFITQMLEKEGLNHIDVGAFGEACSDYPDFAQKVAQYVASGECRFGIMIDGKGIGSAIACNKIHGIRAALCTDTVSARSAREHNDANILTLGADQIGEGLAGEIAMEFLNTDFAGGRHQRRVNKIVLLEKGKESC